MHPTAPRSPLLACLRAILPWAMASALCAAAGAQKPSLEPGRLEEGHGIEIDGRLDEAAWAGVPQLGALTQVVPLEGEPPSHPTRVRLAYDREHLFLAIECVEEPGKVLARQMRRDAFVRYDDVVEWWFDTFNDRRFAFWFQITAAGSRGDALLSDSGSSFNKEWDGVWHGRTQLTDRGWQAEVSIPFKTLNFREGLETWGFNLRRMRKINDEEMRWASPTVAYRFWNLSEGGLLLGMRGMHQGLGLDLVPYAKGALRQEGSGEEDATLLGSLGGDATWRVTPSLKLQLTLNTDFAETEVDRRQVNLDRFPLFFPEKRDFFLEDAGLFEFGPSSRRPQLVPFFSRTIGRNEDGEEVPILAGAKLTGRAGDWNVGVLGTLLDEQAEVGQQSLGVVRVSRNLGGENSVGGIVTAGQPGQPESAHTIGADFRLGSSRLFGEGRAASLWGYWLASGTEGEDGDGMAYGLQGQYQTREWNHHFSLRTIEEHFDPALGFVRRPDSRMYWFSSSYTWRNDQPGFLRRANWRASAGLTTDIHGELESWAVPIQWLELTTDQEDAIEIDSERLFESIDEPFDLSSGVEVGVGDYDMWRHSLELRGSGRRKLTGQAELEFGDFFGGDIFSWELRPVFIPNRHLQLSLGYSQFQVDVEDGDFTTQLVEAGVDWDFSPDLSWRNLVQYDNESDDLGLQSRLRWIRTPGQDLFLVALMGWQEDPDEQRWLSTGQELTLKFSYTLSF